ncbi:MAG: clostripain-related cysteine peptidase [Chloroflexota bacterium]
MRQRYWLVFLLTVLLAALTPALPLTAQDDAPRIENGVITDDTPFIEYTFTVEQDGSIIVLDILPDDPDSGLDTLLYLLDANRTILAENDDRASGDLSSRIEYPQADAGEYAVIATRYDIFEGSSTGPFTLTIDVLPEVDDTPAFMVDDAALAARGFPELEPTPTAEWTILAYYGADTDLEEAIIEDFKEFENAGGSNEQVRILVLMDRHPEFSTASDNWVGARLFEVTAADPADAGEPVQLTSRAIADFGERVDSGDGELLAQFLIWGLRSFPAERYAVALGSHGAGWNGVISDDTDTNTIIRLPELRQALALATEAAGDRKFDLLVNDACYMGSVEYHTVMSEFFNYSLASPEYVVDPAHNMTLLTERLRLNPEDVDLVTLAVDLVDRYISQDIMLRPGSDVAYLTSAVTSLDLFPDVVDALNAFAAFVKEDIVARGPLLGRARANAYVYSGFINENELIDLGSLMRELILAADTVEDAEYIGYAQDVLDALNRAVLYGDGGPAAEVRTSSYHNIYFPALSQQFDASYLERGELAAWGTMLRAYYDITTSKVWDLDQDAVSFHEPTAPQVRITNSYPTEQVTPATGLVMQLEVIGRNLAYGEVTVDRLENGRMSRVVQQRILRRQVRDSELTLINSWDNGLHDAPLNWDVTLPQVTDGTNTFFELLNIGEEVATMTGRYRQPGSETWTPVNVVFDRKSGELIRVVSRNETTDASAVVEIPVGSEFQGLRYTVTPDGRVSSELGNLYIWPFDGLRWEYALAPSGEYAVGLTMVTIGGASSQVQMRYLVDSEDADPELRADVNLQTGASIVRPQDWDAMEFFEESQFYRTQSENLRDNITIFAAFPPDAYGPDDLEAIAELVVANYDMQFAEFPDFETITLADGTSALRFDFERQEGIRFYRGRGFAVYQPDAIIPGLVYAYMTTSSYDRMVFMYPMLEENISFFPAAEVNAADTSEWRSAMPGPSGTITHPARFDWPMLDPVEGEPWTRYLPADGPTSGRFAAVGEFDFDVRNPRSAALQQIADEAVLPTLDSYDPDTLETRTYNAAYATWDVLNYTGQRNGVAVIGRLYVSVANQRAYAAWFESPNDAAVVDIFRDIFEPMLDGFDITPVPLEFLGVIPDLVNTGPTNLVALTDAEPELLLRYDNRSLVMFNRMNEREIDISELVFRRFDEAGEVVSSFASTDFVAGDREAVHAQDCYQVWATGFFDLPPTDFPAEICRFRQGFNQTQEDFWRSEQVGGTFNVLLGDEVLATCQTVPPLGPLEYEVGNPENTERQCLVDLPGPVEATDTGSE